MDGHVLTEEEINWLEKQVTDGTGYGTDDALALFATIRSRDEEIKRAYENNALLVKGLSDVETENTILREALKQINEREIRTDKMESVPYELLEIIRKADVYDDLKTIARDALAKVGDE